ncbi:Uncharacterised protein [Bordetella pertussis]|nr:Uncharacterised protein [Bordetella pertussis]
MVFSLNFPRCTRAESSTIAWTVQDREAGRAETLLSVLATCTSLLLPYMGVTPAADNGGLVSIDQPKVTL